MPQIPFNGTADFTVSRTTTPANNSTRVNSSGLIEIVNDNVPRIDYLNQSCPALLVEPSGQNLVLQSAGFQVSGNWIPTNTSVSTGTTAAFTAPDGTTDADLLTSTSASACNIAQDMTMASGTYTISVFGKAGTSHILSLGNIARGARGAWFNLNAGVVTGTVNGGSASMQNYGNGWYRCIYTSSGIVSGSNTFIVSLSDAANGTTATSGTNLYVWGAQLETGSIATTYIPTTTGTGSRAADVISASGALVSGLIGQTEGTIYAEVDVRSFAASAARRIVNIRVDGNNLLSLEMSIAGNSFDFVATSGGVGVTATASGITTGIYKIAVGYNSAASGTVLYVNGVLRDTKTIAIPNLSAAVFGLGVRADGGAGTQLNDRIRAAAIYTSRLSNDNLMLLTLPTNDGYLPTSIWNYYLSKPGVSEVSDCLYERYFNILNI